MRSRSESCGSERTPVQRCATHSAFTLVELAMVIVIIGILMSALFPLFGDRLAAANRDQTMAKLEIIREALLTYQKKNGRLPCPASLTVTKDNDPAAFPN